MDRTPGISCDNEAIEPLTDEQETNHDTHDEEMEFTEADSDDATEEASKVLVSIMQKI